MVAERTLESVTGERMVIQESTPDVLRSLCVSLW
jgi:hypothetical protein